MIRRREFITLLGGAAASGRFAARRRRAQERVRRIGVLITLAADDPELNGPRRGVPARPAEIGLDRRA